MIQRILLIIFSILIVIFPAELSFAQNKKSFKNYFQDSAKKNSANFKFDESKQAAWYEFIIIGTVRNIKDTPAPRSEMFHSEVDISIDRILKGKVNFKNLIIRLESGAITNDIHGGVRIISSIEPRLNISEQVVLFLNSIPKDNYLNSPGVKERHNSFNGKKSLAELSDSTFWVGNNQAFKIQDGEVYYLGGDKERK